MADAATGQEAVNIAEHFDKALGLTGIVLTKLDGDARGGAALSMRAVTGKPIKFAGVGREAGRSGAVLCRADGGADPRDGRRGEPGREGAGGVRRRRSRGNAGENRRPEPESGGFSRRNCNSSRRLGPLENLLGMLPGMGKMQDLSVGESQLKRVEAIMQSMTPAERRRPEILNAGRRTRIARGSGTTVAEVNDLLKQFNVMKKMMKEMGKMQKTMARKGPDAQTVPEGIREGR